MEPSVIEMPELAIADIEVTPVAAGSRHAGLPLPSVFQTLLDCPDPEATTPAELALFAATEIAGVAPPLLDIGKVPVTLVTPELVTYLPSKSTVTVALSLPALVSVKTPLLVANEAELTYLTVFVELISTVLPLLLTVVEPLPVKLRVFPAEKDSAVPDSTVTLKSVVFVFK